MAPRKDQSKHDSMVLSIVDVLIQQTYTDIKADLTKFTCPSKLIRNGKQDGHVPDVTANKFGVQYIFEVETDDTISIEHSREQWKLFSDYATNNKGQFHLVVPEGYEQIATKQAREWDIAVSSVIGM